MSSNQTSERALEKQEHLSIERLKKNLSPLIINEYDNTRPENCIDALVKWSLDKFGYCLINAKRRSLRVFMHARIVINGAFLAYCEEKNIEVQCIYMDSIASWKTENSNEAFIAQGVFKINDDGKEFLHAALFHKAIQHEDEVSFFNIIDEKDYEWYINFRNKYDEWLTSRERSLSEIYVVGGESISYSKDLTWNDLYLTDDIKTEIKNSVDGFFAAKHVYLNNRVPWKRGLLFWGEQGCGKTTAIKVILSQYDFKPVTVQAGLQNPDEALEEAFSYAQIHGPSLIFLEDLGDLLENVNLSHLLQLIDGIESKDGVFVIATGNDIDKIQHNVTDRPSRFDRKIEFTLPDLNMCSSYLKKWFKDSLSENYYSELSKIVYKNHFSYAYLKELYFSSVFEAIKNNREAPEEEDVKLVLKKLTKQKDSAKRGHRSSSETTKLDVTKYASK